MRLHKYFYKDVNLNMNDYLLSKIPDTYLVVAFDGYE